MNYEKEIIQILRSIGNENILNAIYNLIVSIKDIKNIKIIYFLCDIANHLKRNGIVNVLLFRTSKIYYRI